MPLAPYPKAIFVLASALGGFAALGCASADSASPRTTDEAQSNVLVCNPSRAPSEREFYVLSAIRKKLQDYPDLAAAVGADPPTTCEEARAFAEGFARYDAEHPGFDADQPLGPPPAVVAVPLGGPEPTLDIGKIQGGTAPGPELGAFPRAPVVRITQLDSPNTGRNTDGLGNCTASFIAKNWAVTAAHCLAITRPVSLPQTSTTANDLYGYARWQVEWPDAAGLRTAAATLTAQTEDVLQQPDPRYMGTNPTRTDSGLSHFDFALLYFPEDIYDTRLPPRADTGAAMRLSLTPPAETETISTAGYGTGSPNDPTAKLEQASMAPPLAIVSTRDTIEKEVASVTEATLCKGDSGGPAYRVLDIGAITQPADVPFEQAPTTVPVMLGVSSVILLDPACHPPPPAVPPDGCPLPSFCAQPGDVEVWKRVDGERLFVEERIGLWQDIPSFQCREGHASGSGTNTFIECWGTACESDGDCDKAKNEYCRRPSFAFQDTSCQTCLGACDCIVGQCVVGPPLSANQ